MKSEFISSVSLTLDMMVKMGFVLGNDFIPLFFC